MLPVLQSGICSYKGLKCSAGNALREGQGNMLFSIMVVSAFILLVIAPIIAVVRYYKPANYSIIKNIFWIAVAIITWPLIPLALSMQYRDTKLTAAFWLSLIVFIVSIVYWATDNIDTLISVQQKLLMS
jgi:hypothetical protein